VAGVDTPLLAEVGGGVMLMAPADENADRGRPMQANERRWRAVARELAIREAMLALLALGRSKTTPKQNEQRKNARTQAHHDDGQTGHTLVGDETRGVRVESSLFFGHVIW